MFTAPAFFVLLLVGGAAFMMLASIKQLGSKSRMKGLLQRKKRLRKWRKKHAYSQDPKATGEPPMPFYVTSMLQRLGDPRAGISTESTDRFLAGIRRRVRSSKKHD